MGPSEPHRGESSNRWQICSSLGKRLFNSSPTDSSGLSKCFDQLCKVDDAAIAVGPEQKRSVCGSGGRADSRELRQVEEVDGLIVGHDEKLFRVTGECVHKDVAGKGEFIDTLKRMHVVEA